MKTRASTWTALESVVGRDGGLITIPLAANVFIASVSYGGATETDERRERERKGEREAEVQDRTREPAASFPAAAVDAKLTARRGLRSLHTVHSGQNLKMSLICPILWYIALSYAML